VGSPDDYCGRGGEMKGESSWDLILTLLVIFAVVNLLIGAVKARALPIFYMFKLEFSRRHEAADRVVEAIST